ncbi:MAG: LysM peptidoglycan-binding domain-containing protein [Betaproteobacteria bacterium]|nr:LysM peptidoglycan-binding domain-containing protein [Betaproteobacteria bacterium]
MRKAIISLILLLTPALPSLAADAGALKEDAPDRYIVVPGDTLWSISGRFLKDPWKWPELFKMNQDQIKNPHRIYPGNVLVLDRSAQEARLRLLEAEANTVKLSPRVRAEPLAAKEIPAIQPSVIEPFLSKPLVVGQSELDGAAAITATQESRVAIGAGNTAYARGLTKDKGDVWQIFRRGDALVDPDTQETLGYETIYLGDARVLMFAEQSTIEIVKSVQEIYVGDRLLPASKLPPTFAYAPRAPQKSLRGRIVSAYGSLNEVGPASIIALSKGSRDGLEVGHVLAIYRNQVASRYSHRTSPLYGRQGPTGSDEARPYYQEATSRDAPLYASGNSISQADIAKLPDERYGLVMVFRTFDRASFGLVMQASRPVTVHDIVTNP